MRGPVILPPMMCRKCGAYLKLYHNGNSHRGKLQDVKRWEPKNPNFSQSKKVIFRKSGWRFSISMQLNCEVQNRGISPVFRKQIWSFFAKLSAEVSSKWTVARQNSVGLVDLYSTSDENKQGKKKMNSVVLLFANERTAAKLLDMKPTAFRGLVNDGRLPKPRDIAGHERWDVEELRQIARGDIASGMGGVEW